MKNRANLYRIPSPTPSLMSVLIGITLCSSAFAADPLAASDSQLTEIVVTAQHRTENLQDVPISAQVIGGRSLADQNFNSLATLSQTVPSLHVSAGGADSDM